MSDLGPGHGRTREQPQGTGCILEERESLRCEPWVVLPALAAHYTQPQNHRTLPTLVRAEAPLLVSVEVRGGGAPEVPIAAALPGTGRVLLAQEDEGEDAQFPG